MQVGKMIIAAAVGFAVASCSSSRIVSGNPNAVMIERDGTIQNATRVAEKHCARYGKGVRLIHSDGKIMSFDCV